MRTIELRGFDLKRKMWIYGELTYLQLASFVLQNCPDASQGQNTGWKDINGRDIFEGDILFDTRDGEWLEVEWDEDSGCFKEREYGENNGAFFLASTYFYDRKEMERMSIKGNVYQHHDPRGCGWMSESQMAKAAADQRDELL